MADDEGDFVLVGDTCVKPPPVVTTPDVTPSTTAVCHRKQNGKLKLRNVKNTRLEWHLAHGDKKAVDGKCVADEDGVPPVTSGPGTPGTTPPVVTPPKTPGKPGGGGSDGGSTEGPGKPGADKPNKPGKPGAGSPNKPIVDGVEGERPAKGTKGDRPGNGPEPVKVSELVVVPAKENTSRVNRPGARVHRPAAKILPATGAGDNLGLLGATGLGMVLFGGLLLTGQRRLVRVRR